MKYSTFHNVQEQKQNFPGGILLTFTTNLKRILIEYLIS